MNATVAAGVILMSYLSLAIFQDTVMTSNELFWRCCGCMFVVTTTV